jgi:predicted nucleic acid-binding protein
MPRADGEVSGLPMDYADATLVVLAQELDTRLG